MIDERQHGTTLQTLSISKWSILLSVLISLEEPTRVSQYLRVTYFY